MLRFLRSFLGVAWLMGVLSSGVSAEPPVADDDSSLKNALAVQQALAQARHHLYSSNAGRAVEILEESLPRINGNSTYLRTLREAYRSYIQDLWLANNGKQARRYLDRLCVIDPSAALDPILRGGSTKDRAGPRAIDARPQPALAPASLPASMNGTRTVPAPQPIFAPPATTTAPAAPPSPKKQDDHLATSVASAPRSAQPGSSWAPAVAAARPTEQMPLFRGKLQDPFDMTNQRYGSEDRSLARQLQAGGEAAYAQRNYDEARTCFERAYQADPQAINGTNREHWAYCILCYVRTKANQANVTAERFEELRKLVHSAVAMSAAVSESSEPILRDIDNRRGQLTNAGADAISVQHKGKNAQGWHLAETAHFRVLHQNQSKDFVAKVARTAEITRRDMFRKWFGHDGIPWDSKCDLFLHATAQEYGKATGAPLDAPGHATIEWAENKAGVVSRRIDIRGDQNAVLETVLPRETTHVVLAGMFGAVPMPRWADVGMAVLTESAGRVGEHRRNLAGCCKDGSLFAVRELLQLADYPDKQRIRAFYAESVALVEFLVSQRGPSVFAEFVRDAGREGYELALRRHYAWNFSDLEAHWAQYVLNESARLARVN